MPKMDKDESKLIEKIQEDLAAAKQALHRAANNSQSLARINRDAGRVIAGNAAMRLQGALISARGKVIEAHADASDAMHDAYDDGDVVIMGGGGGR